MKKLLLTLTIVALVATGACSKKATTGTASPSPTPDGYCSQAQAAENESRALENDTTLTTPDAFRTALTNAKAKFDGLAADVPAAIKADYETVRTALGRLIAELEKIGYDLRKATPDIIALFEDAETEAATERLNAYHKANCPGFVLSNETPSPAAS